jgi:5-methylcytosine-specific restriction endonuclease McrA
MDRISLERFLALGLSLEQIGARVNRHPSTVGYWMAKYGLTAVHRERHAARGAVERQRLEAMVQAGASHRELAAAFGVSTATVRYWLKRFGLVTDRSRRRNEAALTRGDGRSVIRRHCSHHGETDFFLEGRGSYRCLRCRRDRVARRRRKVKGILVDEAGGECCLCGYDRYPGALQFHHLDPDGKGFGLAERGLARALAKSREEAAKCVLLCGNCHAEVGAGVREVPVELTKPVQLSHTEG